MIMGMIGLSIGMDYVRREIVNVRENQIVEGFDGKRYNLTTILVKLPGEYFPIVMSHWVPHADSSGRLLAATNASQ